METTLDDCGGGVNGALGGCETFYDPDRRPNCSSHGMPKYTAPAATDVRVYIGAVCVCVCVCECVDT